MRGFTPRPYQLECEQAIKAAGPGHHLIVMATGLGKTAVFTHLEGMGRTLIISHRDELVRQPEKYYAGQVSFGVEKAQEQAKDEEIVSASVQSLSRDSRLSRYAPDAFETIIIDEAHHAAAPSYQKIINYFSGAKRVLGFTATPTRGDGVRLDKVFDDIIYTKDIRWGITNNYLSRVRCERVEVDLDLSQVSKTNGDYNTGELEDKILAKQSGIIPQAAQAYKQYCHDADKHTIIYCVTRNVCAVLAETIKKILPETERETITVLLGDTPDAERSQILSDFQKGKIRCIINCMVLTEGADLPICDAVMNVRPTCNNTLYQQMVGRGTRLYDKKEYCLIVDIVPESGIKGNRTLCTAPTLFGIDPFALDEKNTRKLTKQTDLLQFCDSLSSAYAERAGKLYLINHQVNLFIQEFENLVTAAKNLQDAAKIYQDLQVKRRNDAYERFGDLAVEVFADEERRYRICPNWYEEFWLSEPNVLDHVMVTFIRKDDVLKFDQTVFRKEIPFEKAIDLIQMHCEAQPDYYRYCWSKKAQEAWRQQEATPAQSGKLKNAYRNECCLASNKEQSFDKLTASQLINLIEKYHDNVKTKKTLDLAESGKMGKAAKAAKDRVDAMLQNNDQANEPETFENFCTHVEAAYQNKIEEQRKRSEWLRKTLNISEDTGTGFLTVNTTYPISENQEVSSSQAGYLLSLMSRIQIFQGKEDEIDSLTKRQAALMITFLKQLNDMGKEITANLEFLDAWDVCMKAEEVECGQFEFKVKIIDRDNA